jgi:hypothetical protein
MYKHSELLSESGLESYIYHPTNPTFSCTWFDHKAKQRCVSKLKIIQNFRRLFNKEIDLDKFDPSVDFLIIPEIWAAKFAGQCYKRKIKYAIFVQNGYFINLELEKRSPQELREAYERASLIMSISDDTNELISLAYPTVSKEKIVRLFPHINDQFKAGNKSKIISYMPRKLTDHSQKVCFYLTEQLPPDWKIVPIHNLSEKDTANVLAQSSVFMSFCDLEGFALPPLEAALSGAVVIGYTGQGAKEYFTQPNFQKIENGDFKSFIHKTLSAINDVESGMLESEAFLKGINEVKSKYSRESELKYLMAFAKRVQELYPC